MPVRHTQGIVRTVLGGLFVSSLLAAAAAGASTRADYERADRLRLFNPLQVGGQVSARWLPGTARFTYHPTGLHEQTGTVFIVDAGKGTKRALFDAARMAAALAQASGGAVDAAMLPPWQLRADETQLAVQLGGASYRCTLATPVCRVAEADAGAGNTAPDWAVRSPDGRWDAFVWNHNVYIRPAALALATGPQTPVDRSPRNGNARFGAALQDSLVRFVPTGQRTGCDGPAGFGKPLPAAPAFQAPPAGAIALTADGDASWSYGRRWKGGAEVATLDADRYAPTHGAFAWSPDSRKLLTRREDLRGVGIYPLYSSTGVRPVDHSYYYAGPGAAAIPQYDNYIIDIAARKATRVDVAPTGLVIVPGGAEWSADSQKLYVLSSNRGPGEVRLSLVDPASGAAHTLISETSNTFVEMSNGGDDTILALANSGDDIFWFSQRDGWGHLYRYGADGVLKNQVEQGDYSVAELVHVDETARQIYFTAWGKAPGIPYYRQFYRVNYDGSGVTRLSTDPGDHVIQWLPTGRFYLDTVSMIDKPPVTTLRRADGTLVLELSRGSDVALRKLGWQPAQTFTVKARDGLTDLYGVMYKPSNFDPSKRYPIVTNLYPGPFKGSVGRSWSFQGPDNYELLGGGNGGVTHGEGMGQSLAELGFIVIKLDALGSAHRSKAAQDYFRGQVIDNGLPDQVAAIAQLGARHPWIDTRRAGIFGHSGGGYAAAAGMLLYPDVFKVGVSESGNHDFRSYGWYWGEMYQGALANADDDAAYEAQANYRYAGNLKGKLLLIHGDMDCNNPPAQTLRLADALIRQQKDFDMLIVPDSGHQLPSYAMKRSWDYFVRHLRGEEPVADYLLRDHRALPVTPPPTLRYDAPGPANPLLQESRLPFQMPPFDRIRDDDFGPAFAAGLREHDREIGIIAGQTATPGFDNTIVALERAGRTLARVNSVFWNLVRANTNDKLAALQREMAPRLAAHTDAIMMNAALFRRIDTLYRQRARLGLDQESLHLLERYHTDFLRAGAALSRTQKKRLQHYNRELSVREAAFGQHVLQESASRALVLDSRAELDGWSDPAIDAAALDARARGHAGKFVIALDNTTSQAALALLRNRAVRERLMQASLGRGSSGGSADNRQLVRELARLRAEKARLLGYPSYAAFALADQSAGSVDAVNGMLAALAAGTRRNVGRETALLQAALTGDVPGQALGPADWPYYSRKVGVAANGFDESLATPYFELDNVLQKGVFYAASRLYGLSFKERKDLPVYHPDVRVFDVFDADGRPLALFIADFFARPNKQGGAWMNEYVTQSTLLGTATVVGNHLNIHKPPAGQPVLLAFDDVIGMFHEFGHALHAMFSNVRYPRFGGTNVPADFGEYPSQLNEMWAVWPEVLRHYAVHYQTGAPMPQALLDRVVALRDMNLTYNTGETVAAAVLDQRWHQLAPDALHQPGLDVADFEAAALHAAGLDFAAVPPRYRSTYFSHAFAGGYAAGYYAYLWSEKLDADTGAWFRAHGGMTRENGDRFRQRVLARGGSIDGMQLYRAFTGHDAGIAPLLARRKLE